MMNIADLVDKSDPQGRTFREINNAIEHKHQMGTLVELDNGVRLFIALQTRDCDGTPLYSLTPEIDDSDDESYPLNECKWLHGYPESSIAVVKK